MGLKELTLSNFRCFDEVVVIPDPDAVTVLLSPNGTGKTTILEAVHLLSTGQSFRTTSAADTLKTGRDVAEAHAVVTHTSRRFQIDMVIRRGQRAVTKQLKVNGLRPSSRAELAEWLPLTVFTPEGVDVIRHGPDQRRQLLDVLVVDAHPGYAPIFERFSRVLTQRNSLLKSFHGVIPTVHQRREIEVWNDEFVESASRVQALRVWLLEQLDPLLSEGYSAMVESATPVRLEYLPSNDGSLEESLMRSLRDDIQRGYTTVGPHRDDFRAVLDGRDARRQASQGEQRSLALALRLSAHHLVEQRGVRPLILLDDVFSELDPHRAARLVELLPPGQTLVTTAVPLPGAFRDAHVIDVRGV